MKRFVKNISMILIRLIIFIVIISAIIAVFELVLKFKNTHIQCETEDELYINGYYSDFNNIVNRINTQKILAGFWNYNAKDYTIMKRGDKIGSKNGKKRILVVGDSFVWGWAQDNINNVWWKQLSYALKKNGYQDVEIIAAGMNGFSIVDETQKIILDEEYIESIQPDLIIIGYVYNDWEIMDEKDEYFVKDLD
jgi:hypothetical protein